MDSYIRGVVAGEMPSSWPLEALKVQAVAARTYALSTAQDERRVRPVPRHALAGVPRRDRRERPERRRGGRHRAADRDLRRRAGGDLLLLDLGRPDGERGVLVHRLAVEALARERAGPVRQPVALPPLDRAVLGRARSTARCGAPGAFKRAEGHGARRVAARGARQGGRDARQPQASPGRRCAPRSGCATRGSPTTAWRAPPCARARPARRAGARGRGRAACWPGAFQPAPRTHVLGVERRGARGRFHFIARTRTSRSGRYRVTLTRSGVYRVAYGAVKGPAVRIR